MSDDSKIVDFQAFLARGRREGRELLRDDLLRGKGGAGSPIGATVNGVRGIRSQVGESAGRIGLLARAAFRRERVVELPTTETDPGLRFEFAAAHYGAMKRTSGTCRTPSTGACCSIWASRPLCWRSTSRRRAGAQTRSS